MIQFSEAGMRYGARVLFEGLDWLITPQDRIGIVGANGTGKTTLLRILAGQEHLDHGRLAMQKGLRIGYLPQEGLTLSGRSVFDECLSVFDEAIALEAEQEELAEKMSAIDPAGAEYEQVADRYQWVSDRYHALDGYTKEAQVGTVLAGLAFAKSDWHRPTEEFSGGWQMRIALAKLLLEKPNLLLLDEPTNHLDLEARNWLEDYLRSYPYAYIVISHDRYFLDITVKRVVEIWNKKAHFYAGNYSKYEKSKQQQIEQIRAAYKNQQDRVRQLEAFITRFRYKASKARQVQSRVKELEKIERIRIPDEESTIRFKFPQPASSGRIVMEFAGAAKSYGSNHVLEDVSFLIEKGDRIALVGVNGAGKSTLIRMLSGSEPLSGGKRVVGHNVEIDHFAQDQYKELDPEACLFDDLAALLPGASDSELRGILGSFLFSGDDVFKRVGVLSGGERNRFALSRMLVKPSNFMLLDEPTNHLDMRAKGVLLRALLHYSGTVIFVSHDRYFIDRIATKVFAVGEREVRIYPGNYENYVWSLEREASGGGDTPESSVSPELRQAIETAKQETNGAPTKDKKRRMNPQQVARLRGEVADIERGISETETEIEELQRQLPAVRRDHVRSAEITSRMEALRAKIETREKRWEELSETIEAEG